MIQKKSILVTSAGRTGTAFFANLFGKVLQSCDSFHEPDVSHKFALAQLSAHFKTMRRFGLYRYTLGKVIGDGGLRSLSVARIGDMRSTEEIAHGVLRRRKRFVESLPGEVYVESNNQLHGLVDIIPRVFSAANTLYIVRDGRDWVRSRMNSGRWFSRLDILAFFERRLTPGALPGDENATRWSTMSRFEKLCWSWAAINQIALDQVEQVDNARVFRFEDLFASRNKYAELQDLFAFATNFDGESLPCAPLDGALEKRVNVAPSQEFPGWDEWSDEQKDQFERHCGTLMRQLGYSQEVERQVGCSNETERSDHANA